MSLELADQLRDYAGPPIEVIACDPAWRFKANSTGAPQGDVKHGRNASRHYRTMSLAEIQALPVKPLIAPNSVCFMWITGPFLAIGAHVPILRAWGFKPSSIAFTWVKLRKRTPGLFLDKNLDLHKGLGLTTRKGAEFVVMGVRGKSLRQSRSVQEVGLYNLREHSRKPDEFRSRIEEYVGPGRVMVELFARAPALGWTVLGDETEKFNGAR